jgi:hypothetical protein
VIAQGIGPRDIFGVGVFVLLQKKEAEAAVPAASAPTDGISVQALESNARRVGCWEDEACILLEKPALPVRSG